MKKINSFFLVFTQVIHMCLGQSRDLHMDAVFIAYFTLSTRFVFCFFMWLLLSWLISIEIMQILLVPSSLPISSSTWVCVCMCVYSVAIKTYVACGFPVFLCRFFFVLLFCVFFFGAVSFWCLCFFWFCKRRTQNFLFNRFVLLLLLLATPFVQARLLSTAYLPQAFVVPVLPSPLPPSSFSFSPVSRFLFKCNRKRILIFPFTQKTATNTTTRDTQAVFFFFGREIWQRCTFLCALFLLPLVLLLLLFLPCSRTPSLALTLFFSLCLSH